MKYVGKKLLHFLGKQILVLCLFFETIFGMPLKTYFDNTANIIECIKYTERPEKIHRSSVYL